MVFSKGHSSLTIEELYTKISDADLVAHYLGVYKIPNIIKSPLRIDNKASFGLYSTDGKKIKYIDFATKEGGGILDLLEKLWNCSLEEVIDKIQKDVINKSDDSIITKSKVQIKDNEYIRKHSSLQCKIREWRTYDLEYWESFGISLEWLKYAEIYPVSFIIITKKENNKNKRYTLSADKYAYAYVEHKEGKTTLKIYQPFNTEGYKWSNKHDKSVISLWTKIPEKGPYVCVCSSVKDALCLWSNIGIPCIAIQGEGYKISNTAIQELKKRFKQIFICLDNDPPGLKDAQLLAKDTGFTNIILPKFTGGKDISDLYKSKGKEEFIKTMKQLFFPLNNLEIINNKYKNELPF